jgi:hypothetical protein
MAFLCPSCQKMLTVPEQYAGQMMKCPLCGGTITVPAPPAGAPSIGPRPQMGAVGNVVGIMMLLGVLLVIGSIAAVVIGPEQLFALYERARPVLPFFLAGVGLLVLSGLVAAQWPRAGKPPGAGASANGAGQGEGALGEARCDRCQALNDARARFCNQCGGGLGAGRTPTGIQDGVTLRSDS